MTEIPDLTRFAARMLDVNKRTAAKVVRLAEHPYSSKGRISDDTFRTLASLLGVSEERAMSVLFTVMSVISQSLNRRWDPDADALFLYSGPVDGQVRPFWLEHVGKVYSVAAIRALDNGQLPDVLLTRGGWECRHHWAPLGRLSERREMAGTDERLPEVVADLAARSTNTPSDLPPWSRWPNCPGPLRG